MTRKEYADQLKYWLGLQDISSYDETLAIDQQLLWGTIDLLARTKCVARCVHLQTSAGVDTYFLDHQILALVEVEDGRYSKARRDQTKLWPGFTLIRSDVLRINPIPEIAGELDVWAVKRPAQMTADSDSPGEEEFGAIPDEFQDVILTYALWKLSDYSDDSGSGQGERYRIAYEGQDGNGGRLRQIRSQVNKRGTARAAARTVNLRAPLSRGAWVG